jgi:hypothetical protein
MSEVRIVTWKRRRNGEGTDAPSRQGPGDPIGQSEDQKWRPTRLSASQAVYPAVQMVLARLFE